MNKLNDKITQTIDKNFQIYRILMLRQIDPFPICMVRFNIVFKFNK